MKKNKKKSFKIIKKTLKKKSIKKINFTLVKKYKKKIVKKSKSSKQNTNLKKKSLKTYFIF